MEEINFKNIDYLNTGNAKQKQVFRILKKSQLFESLKNYDPILVGTIPINIDIDGSDLDIILKAENLEELKNLLAEKFSEYLKFEIKIVKNEILICNFEIEHFPFEIFTQNIETDQQNGYLHMIKEYEILQSKDENFAEQIRNLKRKGIKTEPAFCELLGIKGDPYVELLRFEML